MIVFGFGGLKLQIMEKGKELIEKEEGIWFRGEGANKINNKHLIREFL